jgi:RNA-binding protein YlmH
MIILPGYGKVSILKIAETSKGRYKVAMSRVTFIS